MENNFFTSLSVEENVIKVNGISLKDDIRVNISSGTNDLLVNALKASISDYNYYWYLTMWLKANDYICYEKFQQLVDAKKRIADILYQCVIKGDEFFAFDITMSGKPTVTSLKDVLQAIINNEQETLVVMDSISTQYAEMVSLQSNQGQCFCQIDSINRCFSDVVKKFNLLLKRSNDELVLDEYISKNLVINFVF